MRDSFIDESRGNPEALRSGRPTSPMDTMWVCIFPAGAALADLLAELWWSEETQMQRYSLLARGVNELNLNNVSTFPTKKPNPKRRRKLKAKIKCRSSTTSF
jgi:hypothetical protein